MDKLIGLSGLTAVVIALASIARADVVTIGAAKDNTLYEDQGGNVSNGAGERLFVGRTAQGALDHRRALVAFDIAGSLPAGATIQNVTLQLYMSKTIVGAKPVSLHVATADWGEGASDAPGEEGTGAPAEPGDATWLHTFYDTQFWAGPGGDFVALPSATTQVGNDGFYTWSSGQMAADVQGWLDNPASDFGWVILGDETTGLTAKRFDSRENPDLNRRPELTIEFIPPAGTGACCFIDGSCLVLTFADCTDQGGVFQGTGTSCSPNNCPQPPGACCFRDGSCEVLSEEDCLLAGGTFQGSNTVCDPTPCDVELTPFVDALPIPPVMQPDGGANNYDIAITEFQQQLHRDLPPTTVWGYDGSFPSPTIEAMSGDQVTLNVTNDLRDELGNLRTQHYLPVDPCPHGAGDGEPKTVVHLHGGHMAAEHDGHPEDHFLPGESKLYVYPNQQLPGTLWFHDHGLGITRLNVYMGLAGFYLLRDDFELSLDLPRDEHEIPLVIQDRSFNADGTLRYPVDWQADFYGDFVLVNGMVWPYLQVDRGKYRFRLLNGSNSRVYTLSLSNGAVFHQIGTDGGLMEAPLALTELTLSGGERADVVIDFEAYAPGTEIILQNSAPAPYPGQKGLGVIPDVMKFIVGSSSGHTNPLPSELRPLEVLNEQDAVEHRDFELERFADPCAGVIWKINGLGWMDIREYPRLGTTEVWSFINKSNMTHPMHMHLVMFQVLDRQAFEVQNGEIVPIGDPVPPDPNEIGWKDTVRADPWEITRVIARFEDYPGLFPYHCHILEHEDHEMMRQFRSVETESVCPEDPNQYRVLFGGPVTGDALDLCESDDVRLNVRQRAQVTPLLPFIRIEYWGYAQIQETNPVLSVAFTIECHVSAMAAGGQNPDTLRTLIKDYRNSFFVPIDQRATPSNSDVTITHRQVDDAADFVSPANGEIRIRQDVFNPGNVISPNWFLKIDRYEAIVNG